MTETIELATKRQEILEEINTIKKENEERHAEYNTHHNKVTNKTPCLVGITINEKHPAPFIRDCSIFTGHVLN
ncbi:MAG: hypothetical protein FWG42_06475 [Clostridiales bacterium]|nr:hypothetical protein [Clostridiales bacterium]